MLKFFGIECSMTEKLSDWAEKDRVTAVKSWDRYTYYRYSRSRNRKRDD
jgi:hypothetical protein